MSLRYLPFVAVLGCHHEADAPAPPPVVMIEVRDATSVIASVRPDRPCRASVGPIEMIVGKDPFVSDLGETHWTGSAYGSGMFFLENDLKVARLAPEAGDHATIFDQTGEVIVQVDAGAGSATVTNGAGRLVRTLTRRGDAIAATAPPVTITGTQDFVLAALISAQELEPEIRMLAACDRVLRKEP